MFFQLGVQPEKKPKSKKRRHSRNEREHEKKDSSDKKTVRISSSIQDRSAVYDHSYSRNQTIDPVIALAGYSTPVAPSSALAVTSTGAMSPMIAMGGHHFTHPEDVIQRSPSEIKKDQLFGPSRAIPERQFYHRRRVRAKALLPKDPPDVELHSFSSFSSSASDARSTASDHQEEYGYESEGELAHILRGDKKPNQDQQVQKLIGHEHINEMLSGGTDRMKDVFFDADGSNNFAAGASFNIISHVRVCQGVATAKLQFPVSWHKTLSWIFLMSSVFIGMYRTISASVVQQTYHIPADSDLKLLTRACNVQISDGVAPTIALELKAWNFLFDDPPSMRHGEKDYEFTAQAGYMSTFWQCSVNIVIPHGSSLRSLNLADAATSDISHIHVSNVAIDNVVIQAHHAYIHLSNSRSAYTFVNLYDGLIVCTDWLGDVLNIESAVAPTYVISHKQTVLAQISKEAAPWSMVRSDGILQGSETKHDLLFTLQLTSHSELKDLHIAFGSVSGAPLYLTLDQQASSDPYRFKSWVGSTQLRDAALTDNTIQQITAVPELINAHHPWKLLLRTVTEHTGDSQWELVSSSGLLRSQSLHTLATLGILKPATHIIKAHVLGSTCERARATADQYAVWFGREATNAADLDGSLPILSDREKASRNENSGLSRWFESEWHSFLSPSVSILGEWRTSVEDPAHCTEYLKVVEYLAIHKQLKEAFSTQMLYNDYVVLRENTTLLTKYETWSGSVKISTVTWRDSMSYVISTRCSFFISAIIVIRFFQWVAYTVGETIYKETLERENFEKAQSYRLQLDSESGMPSQHPWLINAYPCYRPNPGFTLYWAVSKAHDMYHQLVVICRREKTSFQTAGLDIERESRDEIFIVLTRSAVKTSDGIQCIDIPATYPANRQSASYKIDTKQRWEMDAEALYRFKVTALDASGRKIAESTWSSQFTVPRPMLPDDLEPHLLRKTLPLDVSSWELFRRKCLVPKKMFQFPLQITSILVHSVRPGNMVHQSDFILRVSWLEEQEHPVEHSFRFSSDLQTSIVCDETSSLTLSYNSMTQKHISFAIYEAQSNIQIAQGHESIFSESDSREVAVVSCDSGLLWAIITFVVDTRPFADYKNDFNPITLSHGDFQDAAPSHRGKGFINVFPGMIICEGEDYELVWDAASVPWRRFNLYACFLKEKFADPYDATEQMGIDEYSRVATFEQNFRSISIRRIAQNVSNLGRYHWTPEIEGEITGLVKLVITLSSNFTPSTDEKYLQSHTFIISRPLLLSELEYAYASFCRIHNLATVSIFDDSGQAQSLISGEPVKRANLRVCTGLRRPLAFESGHRLGKVNPYIITPGQQIITGSTKLVMQNHDDHRRVARYEVFKAEAKVNIPLVCNVELEKDPYWWTHSDDCYSVSVENLPFLSYWINAMDWWNRRFPHIALPWHKQRFILLRFWPCVWEIVIQIISAITFFSVAFQFCGMVVVYNILETEYLAAPHLDNSHAYISDLVFMSWNHWWRRDVLVPIILVAMLTLQMTTRPIFKSFMNSDHQDSCLAKIFSRHVVHLLTTIHTIVAGLFIASIHLVVPYSICWFVVAVLLDPDTWLPPAILIVGSLGVFVYRYTQYSHSRSYITDQLTQRNASIQKLMFASYFSTHQSAQSSAADVPALELSFNHVRRYASNLMNSNPITLTHQAGKGTNELRKIRQWSHLVKWKYAKVVPTTVQGFWFDDLSSPNGIEHEPFLPFGSRFASMESDYAHHRELFQSMLIGGEVVMLKEGTLSGPRLGYRIETPPVPGSHFSAAIVAEPVFPRPHLVPIETKVQVIFERFDKDKDERLNEIEFYLWTRITHKDILMNGKEDELVTTDWAEAVHHVNSQYHLNGNSRDGFAFEDLLAFYLGIGAGVLDADYSRLVTIDQSLAVQLMEDDELSEDGDEPQAEEETTQTPKIQMPTAVAKIDPSSWSDSTATWAEIYTQITRGETQQDLTDITRDSTIARNIYLTQLALFVPTLGISTLLKCQSPSHDTDLSKLADRVGYTSPEEVYQWTRLLCLCYEDTFIRLAHEIIQQFNELFSNVSAKVEDWADYLLPQEILRRAKDFATVSTGVDFEQFSPTNRELLRTHPCKVGPVAYRVGQFRFAESLYTEVKTFAIVSDKTRYDTYKWSMLAQLLLDIGWIKSEELEWREELHPFMPPDVPSTDPNKYISLPVFRNYKYIELFEYIERTNKARYNMIPGDSIVAKFRNLLLTTDNAFRILITKYISVPSIMFLLSTLGIDLCSQKLPYTIPYADGNLVTCSCTDGTCTCEWAHYFVTTRMDSITKHKVTKNIPLSVFNTLTKEQLMALGLNTTACEETVEDEFVEDGPFVDLQDHNARIFAENLTKIKDLLFIMTNGLAILAIDLCDEFFKRLTEDRIHLNAIKSLIRNIGLSDEMDHYDWSRFDKSGAWHLNLNKLFSHVSHGSDFIGKSEIPYLITGLQKYLQAKENKSGPAVFANIKITADILHAVLKKVGLSKNRKDSLTYWILISAELGSATIASTVTVIQAATTLSKIIFQPVSAAGAKYTGATMAEIHSFVGALPFFALEFVLKAMGINMSLEHQQNLWNLLPKEPLNLSLCEALKASMSRRNHSEVNLSDDEDSDEDSLNVGTSEYKNYNIELISQDFVKFNTLKICLARVFLTGLVPEGIPVMVRLCYGLSHTSDKVQDVVNRHKQKLNAYGVFSPQVVGELLCLLHVEGINLATWIHLIRDSMRLNLSNKELRRVFNTIDVNQNKFLECDEVIVGITVLLNEVLVDRTIELLNFTPQEQVVHSAILMVTIAIIITFLCVVVPTFTSETSGLSSTVQNLLALTGAIAFRSGGMRRNPELEERIKACYPILFGEDYKERLLRITEEK